jgi:hypothetical protein
MGAFPAASAGRHALLNDRLADRLTECEYDHDFLVHPTVQAERAQSDLRWVCRPHGVYGEGVSTCLSVSLMLWPESYYATYFAGYKY